MFRSACLVAISLTLSHFPFCSPSLGQFQLEDVDFSPDAPTESTTSLYVDEASGWSVEVPDAWEKNPYSGVRFISPNYRAQFGVHHFTNKVEGRSLNEVADEWLQDRISGPHRTLSRKTIVLPDGTQAVELLHEIGEGTVGKTRTLIILADEEVYLLIAESYLEAGEGAEADFDQFFNSFKLPPKTVLAEDLDELHPEDAAFHHYLYDGHLAESASGLQATIQANPQDDKTRFCLGIVQFGLAVEHLLQDLNRHGFLTERAFGPVIPPELQQFFPDHPNPEPFSNDVFRNMLQNWVNDVSLAESTLAGISQTSVKLHVRPGLIRFDPVGQGNAVNSAELLQLMFSQQQNAHIRQFGLTLDRGDVHWLRGYLHIQAAIAEGILAHDFRPIIETTSHQLFESVETPHAWMLEESRKREFQQFIYEPEIISEYSLGDLLFTEFEDGYNQYLEPPQTVYLDAIAYIGQIQDVAIIEPQRFEAVLTHLEQAVHNAQQMWKHILVETDDDNEWIPNPQQQSSIDVEVTQPMIDIWLVTLQELQQILHGKKLVPFWRDILQERPSELVRGLNIRKILKEPPARNVPALWIQGTAAYPYIDQGELTELAEGEFLNRLDDVFGPSFPGFALWFN